MAEKKNEEYEVSNKILTVPNVLSFIRFLMIPLFLVLLFQGYNLEATLVFAIAASTDWVDGQVARRTNSVSRLGQLLDPAVDRLLMISGVAALFIIGRVPLWIIVLVVARDLLLLLGGGYLLKKYKVRVPVIFLGKVATTFLYVGFVGVLLNWPMLAGLGILDVSWLPGFNTLDYSWGFWFVYVGLVLAIITTVYYITEALRQVKIVKEQMSEGV